MQRAWFSITVLNFCGKTLTQFEPTQYKVKTKLLLHTGCAKKGLVQAVIIVTALILRIRVLQSKTQRLSWEDRHVHGNSNTGMMYKLDYKNIYKSFTVLINNLLTI